MWSGKKNKAAHTPLKDDAAKLIANSIVSLQLKMVSLLKHWERRLNNAQKKIVLIVFCVIAGAYLTFILGDAIFRKEVMDQVPLIIRGTMPPTIPPPLIPPRDSLFAQPVLK